jgi:hypothetical protein
VREWGQLSQERDNRRVAGGPAEKYRRFVNNRRVTMWGAATAAACASAGCAFFGGGSLADKATRTERMQCDTATAQDDARVLESTPVLHVEGRYSYNESGINTVTATRIVLRPPDGLSASRMTRVLQCHNARVVLGRADAVQLPDDPYALRDAWLDIDVTEEAGNYVAVVTADTVADNIRVFRRARAFGAAHAAAEPTPRM